MLRRPVVAMDRIGLPSIPYDMRIFGRGFVCLIRPPWAVAAWSLEGLELWRQELPLAPGVARPRLQLDDDGEAWVSSGRLLISPTSRETIDVGATILAFACLHDGFLLTLDTDPVSIVRSVRGRGPMWRTELVPPDQIAYAGIFEWEASTGFQGRPMSPWRPRTWDLRLVRDPIVVGERLAVVGAGEYESGLSCRYAVSLDSGEVAWRTVPGPWSHVSLISDAWFLGQQGYGAFEINRVLAEGTPVDRWPVDGYVTSLPSGAIHVIEMENVDLSRTCVSALMDGGGLRRGPRLDGYHTTKPALTESGDLIFWRNDRLQVVDAGLRRQTLARVPNQSVVGPDGEMHLGVTGMLVFSVGNAVWFGETSFRPFIS